MEHDKTIYVHEAHTLWSENGEVYLACDNGTIVFNACLLYTSPSPRDAHESRMPSSA